MWFVYMFDLEMYNIGNLVVYDPIEIYHLKFWV